MYTIYPTKSNAVANVHTVVQTVASLIQLQDLALASGRLRPLHVIAQVRHPRTIELIQYITTQSHSGSSHSRHTVGAVKAVADGNYNAKARQSKPESNQGLECSPSC